MSLATPRRRAAKVLAPALVLGWLLLGSPSSAFAAASTNAHASSASSGANAGVGNGNGVGNGKHVESASTSTSTDPSSAGDHVTAGTAGTSGDPTTPQPLSNADQNSGGANGQCPGGPYCSTRDGSPSGNGNGNGNATGKPCAGCVGKADNKNPQGQKPNGSDHNAGYECDRNHGIGRTNPAHTGCKAVTPPPPTTDCDGDTDGSTGDDCESSNGGGTPDCDGDTDGSTGDDCTPPVCTAPNTVVNGVCTPPSGCPDGSHLDSRGNCQPEPGCVVTEANPCGTGGTVCPAGQTLVGEACVLGEKITREPPTTTKVLGSKTVRTLPFTGASDIGLLLASGILALAFGAVVLSLGRRPRYQARHKLA